jgi:hypothetical protein
MRELRKVNPRFRVVALSATPGECLEAVCTLVHNLLIQRLELRSEQSLDLAKYTHARKIVCLCSQAECQPAAPPPSRPQLSRSTTQMSSCVFIIRGCMVRCTS